MRERDDDRDPRDRDRGDRKDRGDREPRARKRFNIGEVKDLVIDYKKERFEEQVRDFDAVFDTVGGETLSRSFGVLKPGGIVVSVSAIPTAQTARELGKAWWVGTLLGLASSGIRRAAAKRQVRYDFLFMHPSGQQLGEIRALVEAGKIRPVIDCVFPLEKAKEALAYVELGRAKGKVIVEVSV